MATSGDDGPGIDLQRRASAVESALLALLVGGGAGALAAVQGGLSGVALLGVVFGAAVALGGLLAVPALVR